MATQVETYIPLKKAAEKYGIPAEALTRLVRDGIIRLAHTKQHPLIECGVAVFVV